MVFFLNNKADGELNNFLKDNNLNLEELMLWIELLNDLDYYSIFIIKILLKATETTKEEKILHDQFYGNLIKLGLNNYKKTRNYEHYD